LIQDARARSYNLSRDVRAETTVQTDAIGEDRWEE
jgi:hypothetical protein